MNEAIEVLEKAEAVLMKRIRAMRDGSPKWSAASRLNEIRSALKLIKDVEKVGEELQIELEDVRI
jgi:hypothetical protein